VSHGRRRAHPCKVGAAGKKRKTKNRFKRKDAHLVWF
jgi:hypothetical protein